MSKNSTVSGSLLMLMACGTPESARAFHQITLDRKAEVVQRESGPGGGLRVPAKTLYAFFSRFASFARGVREGHLARMDDVALETRRLRGTRAAIYL